MFEKILVALDESDHAQDVLKEVGEIATKFGSEVRIVHVLETSFVGGAGMINLEDSDVANRFVSDAMGTLRSHDVVASGAVRSSLHSGVAVEIDEEAMLAGADVIVTGSKGVGDLKGLILGSTVHKLLHVTKLPVLIIR
jgi:nucleotide-binding universal stress UspA family protein